MRVSVISVSIFRQIFYFFVTFPRVFWEVALGDVLGLWEHLRCDEETIANDCIEKSQYPACILCIYSIYMQIDMFALYSVTCVQGV